MARKHYSLEYRKHIVDLVRSGRSKASIAMEIGLNTDKVMSQARSKRHHIIPRFLIKNWANPSGHVWVFNKQNMRIYQASLENTFVECNRFTTQKNLNFPKDDDVERQLAKLENRVAPIIARIISGVRDKHLPKLTNEESLICKKFFVSVPRRSPESLAEIIGDTDKLFLEAARNVPQLKEIDWSNPNILKDPKVEESKKIITSTAIANFAAGRNPEHQAQVQEFILRHGLEALVIKSSRRSFLLGRCGYAHVSELTRDKKIRKAAHFPVAPDIALSFTTDPNLLNCTTYESERGEDCFVRTLNESMVSHSDHLIGRDKQLLMKYKHQIQKRLKAKSSIST